MKRFLLGLLKIVLGLAIFTVVAALIVYVVVYHYQQSYWVAFLVIGILVAVGLIVQLKIGRAHV